MDNNMRCENINRISEFGKYGNRRNERREYARAASPKYNFVGNTITDLPAYIGRSIARTGSIAGCMCGR